MKPALASDAESALKMMKEAVASEKPYPLVVVDRQMPVMDGVTFGSKVKDDPVLAKTRLIMMTSIGNHGEAQSLQKKGFAGYLTKPVRQSELFECLRAVMGDGRNREEKRIVTKDTLPSEMSEHIRVLVAEDNPTNQQVALAMLKKLGLSADAVANGQEAVDAVSKIPYDMVLMDVRMPQMDGFEATKKIRQHETSDNGDREHLNGVRTGTSGQQDNSHVEQEIDQQSPENRQQETVEGGGQQSLLGGSHIPIVAMTAHAMKGDREKCLQAGMDDYIAKPVQPEALSEVIEKWVSEKNNSNNETEEEEHDGQKDVRSAVIYDKKVLMERMMGDEELANSILRDFLNDIPGQVNTLKECLDKKDKDGAQRAAHSIKGAAGSVGALALQKTAYNIEKCVKTTGITDINTILADLNTDLENFKAQVKRADE